MVVDPGGSGSKRSLSAIADHNRSGGQRDAPASVQPPRETIVGLDGAEQRDDKRPRAASTETVPGLASSSGEGSVSVDLTTGDEDAQVRAAIAASLAAAPAAAAASGRGDEAGDDPELRRALEESLSPERGGPGGGRASAAATAAIGGNDGDNGDNGDDDAMLRRAMEASLADSSVADAAATADDDEMARVLAESAASHAATVAAEREQAASALPPALHAPRAAAADAPLAIAEWTALWETAIAPFRERIEAVVRDGSTEIKSDDRAAFGGDVAQTRAQYGELTPSFVAELAGVARIGAGDVVVDVGSGIGNVLLQLAATRHAACLGVELMQKRHVAALQIKDAVGSALRALAAVNSAAAGVARAAALVERTELHCSTCARGGDGRAKAPLPAFGVTRERERELSSILSCSGLVGSRRRRRAARRSSPRSRRSRTCSSSTMPPRRSTRARARPTASGRRTCTSRASCAG